MTRLDTLSFLLGVAVGAVGLWVLKPALVAAQPLASGCPKCPEPYTYTQPPEGAF